LLKLVLIRAIPEILDLFEGDPGSLVFSPALSGDTVKSFLLITLQLKSISLAI
jgi:hypothetical protein